ncbi:TlpA family protein disulfide reductase [Rhodopirellula baltica]|uniref:Thioredoxin related protein n=1 Tax=Rhodopirellula baltica WH47 TaxID=991778 RepID=F2AL70_RHOBT|nr:TlpA disulfide reductase family protein [Rhodopirellula baltica]EGF29546.1 thioredoxin related protein [Rhodopirellula baltica WH47]
MRLRMFLAIGLLTAPLSPVFVFPSASYGQEATDVPDTTAEDVAEVEPEVLAVPDEIRQLLKEGKPAEAAEVLEAAMQSDAVAEALKPFHQTIATGFVRARQYDKAMEQFGAAVEFELARTDSPAAAEQLSSLIRQVSVYGLHAAQPELAAEWSDRAIDKVRALEAEHPIEIQRPLSRLIQVRASMLARDDEEAAKEMLAKQVSKLEDINATEDRSEKTYVELINLLTAQARLFEDEDGQDRVASAFEVALEAYPESTVLIAQYASNEYSVISGLARVNPDDAIERMEAAVAKLTPFEENRSVELTLRRIKSLESRIESTRKQLEMIGQPAPPLDIDGWANADGISVEDLEGKVVLYDFWAIWCGPCIATFPHLREFREEFGEQGFEVVGITRYYGYTWDEESGKAVNGSDDPTPEEEREAIAKFLQSKDMKHPTIVTPKETELQSNYGVTGIPHAVLVDREGNVQMIKVGSGQANADALHAKIKELLGEAS